MKEKGPVGHPVAPTRQMKLVGGGDHAGGCATATGFAPVSSVAMIVGRLKVPAWTPSVRTWFAVDPDSATAKNGGADVVPQRLSSPAGASKPDRSPTMLSGRVELADPVVQPGPAM